MRFAKEQRRSRTVCLLLSAYCLLLSGCIRRNLTIRSEPPGATLYVNDKLLGTTPHSYDFTWYGGYRILIKKEGFEQLDARTELKAPWYLWIPLDLVMELLPVPIRDTRELAYQLQPRQLPSAPTPPVTLGRSEAGAPPPQSEDP